jgi:hypothetical protein
MSTPRWPAALALLGWTFLVWTTRINNILADDALDGGEKALRLGLALSFTALAGAVGWALTRRAPWLPQAVMALAVWTVGVWVVRAVGIAFADHDAAFIAVHLVLAVVSTVLAALAVREQRAGPILSARR